MLFLIYQGGWICENGVCGPECLVDTDCEDNEYCNTVEGICKEGCRYGDLIDKLYS